MKLSRRTLLGLAVLGAAAGAGYMMLPAASVAAGGTLTPPEVLEQAGAGKLLLIDIRRPDEWARTGLAPPAVPIDMRRKDFIPALKAAMDRAPGLPVALICAGGVRSRRMVRRLEKAGIPGTIDVPEGMLGSKAGPGWIRRGLPVRPLT